MFLLLLAAVLITAVATLWAARIYLYPAPLEPVVLSAPERQVLEDKLRQVRDPDPADPGVGPVPERYGEAPAARVLYFTQRELNGLIAGSPELADRVALHLSDDLVSATVLVSLPPDFPVMAGRVIRVDAGLALQHMNDRPVVVLRGVSIMGVPLPDAWLGGLKGRDLVALYGSEPGFWQAFAEGVRDLRVEQGRLRVELAE
ncbi:hypothetical protein [Thioalkalivibrio thiocyanodenitrificans]|uniref:hypothetical protein n=1 Tax=Thioalkalivibrio thiocyanodenitrificans TaxID=243063 RepID=UPI000363561B|nr:hypothetical protein [Thioalkalivibrio thiocyanodenitrificans]